MGKQRMREEQKRKKRMGEQKRAAHTGTYWLGDRVLADYYGIGTYFEAVVQTKNYETGLYNLKFPATGATLDLPSPKMRKWRKGFVEGERLDEEDEKEKERKKRQKEKEEKKRLEEERLQKLLAEDEGDAETEEERKKRKEREMIEQKKRAEDHLRAIKQARRSEEKRDQDRKFTFMYD